jgi:hypothetical protein
MTFTFAVKKGIMLLVAFILGMYITQTSSDGVLPVCLDILLVSPFRVARKGVHDATTQANSLP